MQSYEYPYTDGKTLKGTSYVIACRSKAMREAGAALAPSFSYPDFSALKCNTVPA